MGDNSGQPFRENCPFAGVRVAQESPDVKPNGHRDALPGQIGQRSDVARMDPSREHGAYRATNLSRSRPSGERNALAAGAHVEECQHFGVWQDGSSIWHGKPRHKPRVLRYLRCSKVSRTPTCRQATRKAVFGASCSTQNQLQNVSSSVEGVVQKRLRRRWRSLSTRSDEEPRLDSDV
jgi:hypothetical protein